MIDQMAALPARVLLLAADACDAEVADGFADRGLMPVLADLRERGAVVDTLAPRGLVVGAVWPTVMTGLDADRHRYYTWLAMDDDGYGTHQTTPLVMEGEPFWTALDAAGRRCAVFDVPHSLADRTAPNRPGAVHDLLVPLKKHGVSMTRFESRPARTGQWEYYFYIDIEGHPAQAHVASALAELQQLCAFYKVLGTYPLGD